MCFLENRYLCKLASHLKDENLFRFMGCYLILSVQTEHAFIVLTQLDIWIVPFTCRISWMSILEIKGTEKTSHNVLCIKHSNKQPDHLHVVSLMEEVSEVS